VTRTFERKTMKKARAKERAIRWGLIGTAAKPSLWATLGATLLLCPTVLAAEEQSSLIEKWEFTLGSYFTSIDTDIRTDSDQTPGTRVDFERDLGLDDTETLFRFTAAYRIKNRHQVNIGYFESSRSGSRVLTRDIQFRDRTIPVGVDVLGTFDFEILEVGYTYWPVLKDKLAVGVSGGVLGYSYSTNVKLTEDRELFGGREEAAEAEVPIPMLGFRLRYAIAPKLRLKTSALLLGGIEVGDYSGSILEADAALEYRAFQNVGFGLSFDLRDFDIEIQRRFFTTDLRYTLSSFQVYTEFGF
jgi:hypothetical protein